jgi:hypothetical protein
MGEGGEREKRGSLPYVVNEGGCCYDEDLSFCLLALIVKDRG